MAPIWNPTALILPKIARRLCEGQWNATWDLVPSSLRGAKLNYYEREMSRDFRLQAGSFLRDTPADEIEWMFLMQHYGLPTRLLDWSESHLTALYFAVSNHWEATDATVWVTRPAIMNFVFHGEVTITTLENPLLEGYRIGAPHHRIRRIDASYPIALRPSKNSTRLIAQKGGFTLHGRNRSPLNQQIADSNRTHSRAIPLEKILIDGSAKLSILKELHVAGFTHSVLFPEMQGICEELSVKYSPEFTLDVDLTELD